MGFTVEIAGADKLMSKLRNIEDVDLEPAVKVTAQAVNNKAFDLARYDSGDMRNGIFNEVLHLVIGGKKTPVGRVVAPVEYSIWHEIGTSKMKAQPFMKPALDEEKEPFNNRVKALHRAAVSKIAKQ